MRIEIGYIFRPENSEIIQESVRLEISESQIELQYSDNSADLSDFNKIGIILGVFNGIGKVTFLECTISGSSFGSGANLIRYRPEMVLYGVHISDWQDLKFSKCIINIPSLFNWVGVNAIKNKLWTEKKISSEIPDDLKLITFERFQLYFSFGYSERITQNEIYLKQYTYLKIVAQKENIHLNEFMDIITHFKKFLLFIANKSPNSESMTLYESSYTYENDQQLIPIELVTNFKRQDNFQLSISAPTLDFKDIESDFDEIIKTWFEKTKLFSSIDLIIEKFLNPKLNKENDFLNSCFAIETFHRRFRKFEVFKKSDFKKTRKTIVEKIEDNELRKFIDEKLSYANEPTFRARLFDLRANFNNLMPSNESIDDYIVKIVKTRNFLVHRGSNKNTFNEFDMFFAARYLEGIVRICILNELKIPDNIIHKTETCIKKDLNQIYHANKKIKTSMPYKVYSALRSGI